MPGRKKKFEIISPDVGLTPRTEVDWENCFIMQQHKATFHKTCMTRYDSHKLHRFKSLTEPFVDSSSRETPHSLRSSSNAKNFIGRYFFCNQTAEDDVLHQRQTFHMGLRVRKIPHGWVIQSCLPSLVKEIWLLSKLCAIRIVLKSCTFDTEVTKIGNHVIETTWR